MAKVRDIVRESVTDRFKVNISVGDSMKI